MLLIVEHTIPCHLRIILYHAITRYILLWEGFEFHPHEKSSKNAAKLVSTGIMFISRSGEARNIRKKPERLVQIRIWSVQFVSRMDLVMENTRKGRKIILKSSRSLWEVLLSKRGPKHKHPKNRVEKRLETEKTWVKDWVISPRCLGLDPVSGRIADCNWYGSVCKSATPQFAIIHYIYTYTGI